MNTKKLRKFKGIWIGLFVLVFLSVAMTITLYKVYSSVKATVDDVSYESIEAIDVETTREKVEKKEVLNVLLLGVDERVGDRGRSDTMIVMTLDPTNSRMQMVSIPRDTRTEIIGEGIEDKINHAYALGGSETSVATVEHFLSIELDYFIRVNMEGLEKLVDALGGIAVTNDYEFSFADHYTFKKGPIELDGKQALAYVSMRKQDPEGDLGRNKRQRQVIQSVLNEGISITSITKIHKLIEILGDDLVTNMKFEDMRNVMLNYKDVRKDLTMHQMTGVGEMIEDVWYLLVSDDEIKKTHDLIEGYSE